MKKIFTLVAVAATAFSVSAEKHLWTMDAFQTECPTVNTETAFTYDGLTYNGRGSSAYAAGATIEKDGYSFTFDARLKVGGNSTFKTGSLKGVFEFEAEAGEPIIVFATHGSSTGDARYVYASNAPTATDRDKSTAFGSLTLEAGTKGCMVATNPETGKVYIWIDGNNAIYGIAKGYTLEELNTYMNGGSSEEPEVPAEGEAFSAEAMGMSIYKTCDDLVTPFSFDYSTKVATFDNLFGTSANIKIKFELSDPNTPDPEAIGIVYNSIPESGCADDGGEYAGYTINNFDGSVILKENGATVGKFENLKLWAGYNSQLSVEVEGTGNDAKKVFQIKIMFAGAYTPWDASTSSWGTTVDAGNYVTIVKNFPLHEGDESGIDNIVTDSVDENAPVEYYNLQGIRLSEPAAGQIVIRRQGSKVSKIIVR